MRAICLNKTFQSSAIQKKSRRNPEGQIGNECTLNLCNFNINKKLVANHNHITCHYIH